jgi:phytoene/squalene synthetase
MKLFNQVCYSISRNITERYSTSFTIGIKTLHHSIRNPIYAIYGFVRVADEIVDTFHDYDKKKLLEKFKADTYQAIHDRISTNPVLHAFQLVVHQYQIDHSLIEAFLKSMEMDLYYADHSGATYSEYIYGSAEVVGLMCLHVFCNGDKALYEKLKEPARKLGAAFQKVNFLRDMQSDFVERGRVYFPGVSFSCFDDHLKKEIERDIKDDFKEAYKGIVQLPWQARRGVYAAFIYYRQLLYKIERVNACQIQKQRIRVPDSEKVFLLLKSFFRMPQPTGLCV